MERKKREKYEKRDYRVGKKEARREKRKDQEKGRRKRIAVYM